MCLRRLYAIINLKVGDDMKKRHMNVIAIIIIILSTIVFLWKVFLFGWVLRVEIEISKLLTII